MRQSEISVALVIALFCCTALAACGPAGLGEVTCSSDGSVKTAISLIKDQVEKDAINKSKKDDGTFVISPANIRASIAQLKITIDEIRTTKSDPSSTKKFCTGTAKITFPIKVLADADAVRSAESLNSVSQLTDAANAQRDADTLSFNIDYDVQPTDDKKEIFAESDSFDPQMQYLSEVLISALLKPGIDSQQAAAQQQAQQQNDARRAAAQADHDQAVADNKLSIQTISAAWQAIDTTTRAQILPQQRDWIASKDANCKTQAASTSTDPVEQETARLKCDTAANQTRIDWLKQYVPGTAPQ